MTNGWNEGLETAAALADAADASNPDAGFSDLALLIRALRTGSPVAEPVAWMGFWAGAGSINSLTRTTHFKSEAERWRLSGVEVQPLYLAPPAPAVGSPGQVRVKKRYGYHKTAGTLCEIYELGGGPSVGFAVGVEAAQNLCRLLDGASLEPPAPVERVEVTNEGR